MNNATKKTRDQSSLWKRVFHRNTEAAEPLSPARMAANIVRESLEELNQPCKPLTISGDDPGEPSIFLTPYTIGEHGYLVHIQLVAKPWLVLLQTVQMNVVVPARSSERIKSLLERVNQRPSFGQFAIDEDELVFEYRHMIEGAELTRDQFKNILTYLILTAHHHALPFKLFIADDEYSYDVFFSNLGDSIEAYNKHGYALFDDSWQLAIDEEFRNIRERQDVKLEAPQTDCAMTKTSIFGPMLRKSLKQWRTNLSPILSLDPKLPDGIALPFALVATLHRLGLDDVMDEIKSDPGLYKLLAEGRIEDFLDHDKTRDLCRVFVKNCHATNLPEQVEVKNCPP